MWTRIFFIALFLFVACFNSITAIHSPEIYLSYWRLNPLTLNRKFINGFFLNYITLIVLIIAVGQFLIALGLMLNKFWVKHACIEGIIFGLAIATLGIGSAFPSTVFMAIAFYILLKRKDHDFIWNLDQYRARLMVS